MTKKIQAIDFMYYVATREFMEQWDRAKEGELICRMEKAIGGLPRFASIEEMVRQMDEEGFGNCTNTGACEIECPKGISLENIARMNREYLSASLK